MDRLPHLINTEKKFSVVNNLVRQLGLHLSRACLVYKGNRPFLLMHYPSSLEDYSDFYGVGVEDKLGFYFSKISTASGESNRGPCVLATETTPCRQGSTTNFEN
jgi:hypothetical protein